VQRCDAPSTLAFVEHAQGTNRYAFYTQATADTLWAPAELPELPPECRYLQFGSIALLHSPVGPRILDLVAAERGRRIIVFDPNVRPTLIRDAQALRRDCLGWLAQADLVKLSDEDLAFIAPGVPVLEAASRWLALGPRAVVLTRGAAGATLLRAGHAPVSVRPPAVQLVDTIGAGDTFGAALSVALLEQGVEQPGQLQELPESAWRQVLRFAATAAALNCTRAGAQPPRRTELDAALAAHCGG
jgi:fructokinase